MTFATFTNILLMALCVAVLVQSARMMRAFKAIQTGDLGETVKQLDRATAQARTVLAELKDILATDGAASVRTIQSGETLRDELSVMVGIGNAVAERIMDAAASTNAVVAANEPGLPADKPVAKARRRKRGGSSASRTTVAAATPMPAMAEAQ
ncbi:DUF6468 domain-containing protein [Sphingomonas sp. KC8]|uniref:DUF6468 domain-containing protein n=1 Tax=Sphingomonas sp. KC8 TaxID=1030157 RepID=UPI0002488AA2|nr:DUF6468 domain-containing protein [Sphingomonas sp. KC8]ARS28952.1 hypothetical protein KC8_16915 [Sphingomonas sp. KC8]